MPGADMPAWVQSWVPDVAWSAAPVADRYSPAGPAYSLADGD
jgi:hypothetical protein